MTWRFVAGSQAAWSAMRSAFGSAAASIRSGAASVPAMADLGTQLDIEAVDDGFVLTGEIDAHTAPLLDDALGERMSSGSVTTRLDMGGVTFMDSSGLRVVIARTQSARTAGGDLVLASMTPTVQKLIEVSGLRDHLSIAPAD